MRRRCVCVQKGRGQYSFFYTISISFLSFNAGLLVTPGSFFF